MRPEFQKFHRKKLQATMLSAHVSKIFENIPPGKLFQPLPEKTVSANLSCNQALLVKELSSNNAP
jgi:hypothetical protein